MVPNSLSLTVDFYFLYSSPPVVLFLEGTNHSKYGVTSKHRKHGVKYLSYFQLFNMHM